MVPSRPRRTSATSNFTSALCTVSARHSDCWLIRSSIKEEEESHDILSDDRMKSGEI